MCDFALLPDNNDDDNDDDDDDDGDDDDDEDDDNVHDDIDGGEEQDPSAIEEVKWYSTQFIILHLCTKDSSGGGGRLGSSR